MARDRDRFQYADLARVGDKYLIEDAELGESDEKVGAQYFTTSVGRKGHVVIVDMKTQIAYTLFGQEVGHAAAVEENVID